MEILLILALAVSAVSLTLSKSHFSDFLIPWARRRGDMFGQLMNCHYCLSHWIAGGLVLMYNPHLIEFFRPLDILVTIFAVVAVSAVISCIIITLMNLAAYLGKNNGNTD